MAPELNCVSVFGGASIRNQVKEIEKHVDIVCATPGRLMDLILHDCMVCLFAMSSNFMVIFKKVLLEFLKNTDHIEIVCVDEADELLSKFFLVYILMIFIL